METGSERQLMQCKKSEAAETRGSDSAFFFWLRAGGSARARGRRVNVDSVVDLVVYMYILLCFPVLSVGFVVSVGLLHVVNPVEVYYGI